MLEKTVSVDRYMEFCAARGVTERGLQIVNDVITNPPARRVGSRSMSPNITGRFPSRKMGVTIQAESRTLELAGIYLKEFDPSVLGYWDQPYHRPNLCYVSGSRKVRVQVTMDFFVISDDFIGFEEFKPEVKLRELAKDTPGRYLWNQDVGCYEMPALASYLVGSGLGCRVVSSASINSIYVDNLAYLYNLVNDVVTNDDRRLWQLCSELLRVQGPMLMVELESTLSISRTKLLLGVLHFALHIDLQKQRLEEPEGVLISASPNTVDEGGSYREIVKDQMVLLGSPREVEESMHRYRLIEPVINGADLQEISEKAGVSVRTMQRWLKSYRLNGVAGLRPKHSGKGNHTSRLPDEVERVISEVISSHFLTEKNQRKFHVYQLFVHRCEELGLVAPSRQVFYRRLDSIGDRTQLQIREGAKRAYQATAYDGLAKTDSEPPLTAITRFLQRCHIDHTQLDMQLVSVDGAALGKPWLTSIVDDHTGFVLSLYLSFRSPSSVAVMSAMRLMVKTHGLFPESIVVDGGKEFESVYFESLMAKYRCTILSRKGKPRSGNAVERYHGIQNTIFLDNLDGSNKLAKNVRQLSRSHNPADMAIWEPVDFYHGLLKFADKWNSSSCKKSGLTPAQLKDSSIARFGISDSRKVAFDDDFLREVLLPPKRSGFVLRRNLPIQLNRVNYWHSCLRVIPRESVPVHVKYDPFDLNYIFVHYKGEWLRFRSTSPQHRRVDDLDGSILAEVARQSLYINEKMKQKSRVGMAVVVESINAEAVDKRNVIDSSEIVRDEVEDGSPADNVDIVGVAELFSIDWDMRIPDSEGGV